MLFLPFKVDLNLSRFPVITILVSLACIFIFTQQLSSWEDMEKAVVSYCNGQSQDSRFGLVVEKVYGERSVTGCANIIYAIFISEDSDKEIDKLTEEADRIEAFPADYSKEFIKGQLEEKFSRFQNRNTEQTLTDRLMYKPDSFDIPNMITAAFAHGSWQHVIGNLFFFFAFAASVEIALGFGAYILVFLALAIGTHLAYSFSLFGVEDALPTLGLSGVVMGMIGLFSYLMPTVKIRCLWWFIFIVKILRIPAWILAVWYVGWDLYDLNHSDNQSNINFIAHVSGAIIGFLLGLIFFRKRKQEINHELIEHRHY